MTDEPRFVVRLAIYKHNDASKSVKRFCLIDRSTFKAYPFLAKWEAESAVVECSVNSASKRYYFGGGKYTILYGDYDNVSRFPISETEIYND